MRGASEQETYQGKSIVRWQLLPTVSHQGVSEGQWEQYYEERRTIELDGLGANNMEENDQVDRDPRAEAMLVSARSSVEEVLQRSGFDGIGYLRSIRALVYLLPFTGAEDGSDPRTIAMATVLYSPYETINYITLSFQHHDNDDSSTLKCEQSDGVKTQLVRIDRRSGSAETCRVVGKEALVRTRSFLFGNNAPRMTAWTVLELLLSASAIAELGEDVTWIKGARSEDVAMERESVPPSHRMSPRTILSLKVSQMREAPGCEDDVRRRGV